MAAGITVSIVIPAALPAVTSSGTFRQSRRSKVPIVTVPDPSGPPVALRTETVNSVPAAAVAPQGCPRIEPSTV